MLQPAGTSGPRLNKIVLMNITAVVPAYRASSTILELVRELAKFVDQIVVVDDACPEGTSEVLKANNNQKLIVVERVENGGVGAATKDAIKIALENGAGIIVKVDADLQMPLEMIPELIQPLLDGSADFSKGNRFDSPEDLEHMPKKRLIGNAGLSLISKFTTGYWSVSDPTNGFFAMTSKLAKKLVWEKISNDYFFESDLLFRLRLANARINQMQMKALYNGAKSSLRPMKIMFPFLYRHNKNLFKRIIYMYYVRELNLGSFYYPLALVFLILGTLAGGQALQQASVGPVGTGTVVLSSLGLILGSQFLLQFLSVDMNSEPRQGK